MRKIVKGGPAEGEQRKRYTLNQRGRERRVEQVECKKRPSRHQTVDQVDNHRHEWVASLLHDMQITVQFEGQDSCAALQGVPHHLHVLQRDAAGHKKCLLQDLPLLQKDSSRGRHHCQSSSNWATLMIILLIITCFWKKKHGPGSSPPPFPESTLFQAHARRHGTSSRKKEFLSLLQESCSSNRGQKLPEGLLSCHNLPGQPWRDGHTPEKFTYYIPWTPSRQLLSQI